MTAGQLAYRPERFRREHIQDSEALRRAAAALSQSDAIGVDIEMGQRMIRRPGGVQEWKHSLALVQIASHDLSMVVDPLRCADLSPLGPILAGPARKVFLGGGQDVPMLETAGIPAFTVVDVGEIAYAVFGRREDGMAALSKRIFGLSVDKTVRRTDWLVRPLNPALLTYAFQDAELTLLIYDWFQEHYPEVVSMHERRELEPAVPASVSDWLRDAMLRGSSDPKIILSEHRLDATDDSTVLSADIADALRIFAKAPRRVNRLIRIAGELELRDLLPEIVPYTESLSSLLRASGARAIGKLADREEGERILEQLRQDPIEDVRKAADAALRDLRGPKSVPVQVPTELEEPDAGVGLGEETLAALQKLLQQLEGESG